MAVTKPVITMADLYFSLMLERRNQKNRVDAAMAAKVKDKKS